MLVSNVKGERAASTIVKDSGFYIEIAKFVQAYNTIIRNPNEFLVEIGEAAINENTERLTWAQLVKIMQTCDFGFSNSPTEIDLVVQYNYALQIGSLGSNARRLASVEDVANAQKHYYNFVDEATDRAQTEYLKKRQVAEIREKETNSIDSKLAWLKTGSMLSMFMSLLGVLFIVFGVVGFFYNNDFVCAFGFNIGGLSKQYVGAIILLIVGLVFFAIFDGVFLNLNKKYKRLNRASEYLFKKVDENFVEVENLKNKFDNLKKDLLNIQAELADSNKTFDVKHVIEVLKQTNKYYQKLCKEEEGYSKESEVPEQQGYNAGGDTEEFAPVKLTLEQQENLHTVGKEAINLEGVLDEQAYNEKFENTDKEKQSEKKSNKGDKEREEKEKEEEKKSDQENKQQDQQTSEAELAASIDFMKEILGIEDENQRGNY